MFVTVVFCKPKNPLLILSPVIRWAEGLGFSHSAVVVHSPEGSFVYESTWPRMKKTDLLKWEENYTIVEKYVFAVDDPAFEKDIVRYCDSWIGVAYSMWQLVLIAVAMISAPMEKLVGRSKWNGSRFLICTEFVGNFLERFFGVKFEVDTDLLKLRTLRDTVKKLKGV